MVEDAASRPTVDDSQAQPTSTPGAGPRTAPPPTPMVPTRGRSGSATGSSGGSVVNELVDRFDPGQVPDADESPATAENVEDAEEVDEGDDGLLARLRRRIGLGDDDAAETENPQPESLDETEGADEVATDEPEPTTDADEPAGPAPQPAPVSAETGRPAETRDRPPRGTDAGPRVPARPAPSTETDDDARRRVRPTVTAPGPAPPTGGDLVPGHPDLDGQPERSAGFDDVDVPDPEILHEQVDAVLDHHETGPRRDRP